MGKKEPYIDHQSIPSYDNIEFLNTYDKDTVVRFVFNRDIWLKTECDQKNKFKIVKIKILYD